METSGFHTSTQTMQLYQNGKKRVSAHPAAPKEHSASLSHQCLAGGCCFSVSSTGCTLLLCLKSELGKPVKQSAVNKSQKQPWRDNTVSRNSDAFFSNQPSCTSGTFTPAELRAGSGYLGIKKLLFSIMFAFYVFLPSTAGACWTIG